MIKKIFATITLLFLFNCQARRDWDSSEIADHRTDDGFQEVGLAWIKKVRSAFTDISNQGKTLKNYALTLAFSKPGSDESRKAATNLNVQLAKSLEDVVRYLENFDLILNEGIVLGTGEGVVLVGLKTKTLSNGKIIIGITEVRDQVSKLKEHITGTIFPIVPDLTNPDLETRGQAVQNFQSNIDNFTKMIEAIQKDLDTWPTKVKNPDDPDHPDDEEKDKNKITSISLFYYHNCIVIAGNVKCWGKESYTNENFVDAKEVFTESAMRYTCAILSKDRKLKCWGPQVDELDLKLSNDGFVMVKNQELTLSRKTFLFSFSDKIIIMKANTIHFIYLLSLNSFYIYYFV